MQILEMPEFRKLVEAYRDGFLSFSELKEELEGCWDMKIYGGTKAPVMGKPGVPMLPILTQDPPVRRT